MRASPPLQLSLTRYGRWRAGVLALAGAAACAPLGWLAAQPGAPSAAQIGIAAGLAAAALALGLSLSRMPARSLRWDGQRWHVGPPGSAGDEPWHGDLAVTIDAGGWMLLRLAAEAPARPRVVWIPVQRKGLETDWHALRCAVYSPRPAADGAAPAAV